MTDQQSPFSHKVRVRSCGLLVEDDHILLAQIHSPVTNKLIWTPPGGGIEFGESLEDGLQREFKEETQLTVAVKTLIHCNEMIASSFHALEFYFEVEKLEGEMALGADPELSKDMQDMQLLKDIRWISISELTGYAFAPHSLLRKITNWKHRSDFRALSMLN